MSVGNAVQGKEGQEGGTSPYRKKGASRGFPDLFLCQASKGVGGGGEGILDVMGRFRMSSLLLIQQSTGASCKNAG